MNSVLQQQKKLRHIEDHLVYALGPLKLQLHLIHSAFCTLQCLTRTELWAGLQFHFLVRHLTTIIHHLWLLHIKKKAEPAKVLLKINKLKAHSYLCVALLQRTTLYHRDHLVKPMFHNEKEYKTSKHTTAGSKDCFWFKCRGFLITVSSEIIILTKDMEKEQ